MINTDCVEVKHPVWGEVREQARVTIVYHLWHQVWYQVAWDVEDQVLDQVWNQVF
jgi:hypothetical protein